MPSIEELANQDGGTGQPGTESDADKAASAPPQDENEDEETGEPGAVAVESAPTKGPAAKPLTPQENISRQLMLLLEEDSKEFTELDYKEMMPTSPFGDTAFYKLKEFFDSIIEDLNIAQKVGIPLEEVKEEFNFIWDGIQKSHDNLNSLLGKDVAITVEVADTMAKTRNLIRIAEDHPEISARLGSRLETAWNLVDVSEEEERRNTNKIEDLKTDIMILNRNITTAAAMQGQAELVELIKIRRKLQNERDDLLKDMGRMRTSLALLQERKSRLAEKRIEFQEAIVYADEEAEAQKEAFIRETERKRDIENRIRALIAAVELKTKELKELEKNAGTAKQKLYEYERGVATQKVMNETHVKEADALHAKMEKLRVDYDHQVNLCERLAMDMFKKTSDLKDKEDEIAKVKAEGMQAIKTRNAHQRRVHVLQSHLAHIDSDREKLKVKIVELEKELDIAQKKLEANKKKVEELDKKRTIVNRNLTRAKVVAQEQENQLKIHLVAANNLEHEMESYRREIDKQKDTIRRLERERDYYSHEATKLAHEYASKLDEVKKMDTLVFEFHKKLGELEGTVKTKNQEYEQSLVEKRFFEKILRDTGTQILETQKLVRHKTFELNMAIFSYYEEQNRYAKQKAFLDNLLREGQFFKIEADRIHKMAYDMQRQVEALECERGLLGSGCAEAENELSKQRYYAMQAESRNETYNRRLQQREAELQTIWSSWRTLHSMVRIGAYHFRNLMSEIREIRQRIVALRQLQNQAKGNVNSIVHLQQEISGLENCIAKETCMVNAIEAELGRPINVHRWRALEAIDPDAYDTIKKINIVTRRLVGRNEAIRKRTDRIADKERIYVDLKHVIRRLPSIETPELRQYYEVLLKAKKEQLKQIKLDLYAMESQKGYFRNEVSKLNDRLKELRLLYFQRMKESGTPRKTNRSAMVTSEPHHATSNMFQEYQESLDQDLDEHVNNLKNNVTENFDVQQMQEVFRKYSAKQEQLQSSMEKRKSEFQVKKTLNSIDESEGRISLIEL